jgi:hypothetical protein
MKKPVLFLHNVLGISEEKLTKLCQEENSAERVAMTWKSKDITGDVAIAYFKSEMEAMQAMKWIKAANLNNKKIKTSFQQVSEPAVKITDFPTSLTKTKFFQLFPSFKVSRFEILSDDSSTAVVVMSDKKEVERMVSFINTQNPGKLNMKATNYPIDDWGETHPDLSLPTSLCLYLSLLTMTPPLPPSIILSGFEFSFPENIALPIEEIRAAFREENLAIKSIATDTNISAYIAFETAHEAALSQNSFLSGLIKLSPDSQTPLPTAYHGGGVVSSTVSVYPSYALEVAGVPQDQSAQYVLDSVRGEVDVFRAERSATVKFKKHENVRDALLCSPLSLSLSTLLCSHNLVRWSRVSKLFVVWKWRESA